MDQRELATARCWDGGRYYSEKVVFICCSWVDESLPELEALGDISVEKETEMRRSVGHPPCNALRHICTQAHIHACIRAHAKKNLHKRVRARTHPHTHAADLPIDAFVFCSFNAASKFDPVTFKVHVPTGNIQCPLH